MPASEGSNPADVVSSAGTVAAPSERTSSPIRGTPVPSRRRFEDVLVVLFDIASITVKSDFYDVSRRPTAGFVGLG